MNPNIKFDANIVAKLAPFASNEQTRYYLRGIHVMADPNGGVRLVATDGHALGMVRDPDGEYSGPPDGVIVATDGVKGFVQACRKPMRVVEGDTVSCTLHVRHDVDARPEYIHPEPFIDGTYPDYARAIPSYSEEHRGSDDCFNPRLLDRFKEFGVGIELVQEEKGCPAIVLTADHNAFGVVMPLRGSYSPPDFWFGLPGHTVTAKVSQAAE